MFKVPWQNCERLTEIFKIWKHILQGNKLSYIKYFNLLSNGISFYFYFLILLLRDLLPALAMKSL